MGVSEQDRRQAIEAFRAVATPAEAERVEQVGEEIATVVAQALSLPVRTAEEAQAATAFLSQIAGAKKRAEEARTFVVKPLNDHVKAINARFKLEMAPLDEADDIVRGKVIQHRREVEAARQAEQARLDAERAEQERQAEEQRRAEEARARAEREAAAREAARAEEEARKAEAARREQLEREASDLERRMTRLTDDELRRTLGSADERGPAAQRELDRRREAREAQERTAAAREREEAARRAEEEARSRPLPEIPRAVVAPAAPLTSASGRAAERKRWIGTVVDETRVPREYLKVDQALINAAVRKGAREIPGVRIEQVDELAVRAS